MSAEDSIVDLNGSGLRLSLSHRNMGDEGKGVDVRNGSHEPLIPRRKKGGLEVETSAWLLYKWERMTIVSCPECGEAVGVRSDRDWKLDFRHSRTEEIISDVQLLPRN